MIDQLETDDADVLELGPNSDLAEVLRAWNQTTQRLEQTHSALRDEVRRLTEELEVKNRELARTNRLADLGRMAAHVAHEVRNNLVPVSLYLSLLRRRLPDDSPHWEIVDRIAVGLTSLEATVNDLLHFTTDREPNRQLFRPAELIAEIIDSLAPQLAAQHIAAILDIPARTQLAADRDMLRRAVLNLVLNAIDVMPDGGELVITGVDTPRGFELEIADSGPGLADDVQRHVFEPFYTTKSGGTGLGLAIVQRIVAAHGGHVSACNCPDGGAAFTICLPRPALRMAA